ncbi:ankyrin repeat domain-containing protein [Methylophilaceae bacterium]|jgi:ankyrin repeat protein|nr:ankyrin repeat domain-containing protein [Methylophilaceae bacterium]|tara:strand:+ start:2070 stop:2555 length:486 start_codon:yes stop_codon:yes gene_type:complete
MKVLSSLLAICMAIFSLNVFALNDDQELEFTGAVNEGNLKIVKKYVETTDVKIDDSYFAWTPFLMSAAKNQLEVMKYLVSKGANITYTHPITRFNALHHAAFNGSKPMVDFLVEIGIDKTKKLKGDVSIIRALKEDGKEKMAEYLLSIGFKDEGCQEKRCF